MRILKLFKKKTKEHIHEKSIDDAQLELIKDSKQHAERLISSFNDRLDNRLDYSISSLTILDEEILSLFSDHKNEIEKEVLEDIVAQSGSYIFEVARKNFGGKYYWYSKMNQPVFVTGQPHFEISFLAFDKVKQRIENGNEDNIPFYFKGFSERVRQAKKGEKAMII